MTVFNGRDAHGRPVFITNSDRTRSCEEFDNSYCKCNPDKSRWEELKVYLTELVEYSQFEECHIGRWEEAYRAVLSKMKELEEKCL